MRVILSVEQDDEGNIMIDASSPIDVLAERAPPHRLAIKSSTMAETTGAHGIWVRIHRPEAYRLADQLNDALSQIDSHGAPKITKVTKLKLPLNGGVNKETGDMLFLFQGVSGLEHQFELPFDQSGPMLEILERAAVAGSKWQDDSVNSTDESIRPINIQAREAEFIMLGEDPATGRPIMVARLVGGQQFSFLLDQKIVEQLRNRPRPKRSVSQVAGDPWTTVADDIEFFQKEWCTLFEPPSDAELRRGSAALRRLLVEDAIGHAWRHFGFEREPSLAGPDVLALLAKEGHELRHVASLISGGATLNGLQTSMIGAARADNQTTGVKADADEGFAVVVFSISRDARSGPSQGGLTDLVERSLPLTGYLRSPGAIRMGALISRHDIIAYFANSAGGVHIDMGKGKRRKNEYSHVRELEQKVQADTMDGLYFELLSIGQAVGKSPDLQRLVERIRSTL